MTMVWVSRLGEQWMASQVMRTGPHLNLIIWMA